MTVIARQPAPAPDDAEVITPDDAEVITPDGAAVISIRLLGRFAVERNGQEIPLGLFGGRLARRLLRLLALRRGTLVHKDLIADALWPDNPPVDPAGNIEVLVSRVRRALGDRALVLTGPGGYVLADGGQCWVDAEAFLAAVQDGRAALAASPARALTSFRTALGIWHGDPLPEDTYANWAQADRRRLFLSYLEALDGAAAAALASAGAGTDGAGTDASADAAFLASTAAEAVDWARQATAADPLRESSVLLLVRALAAVGEQAAAASAFAEHTGRLAAEAGLQPTPHAREICLRILAGGTANGPPGPGAAGGLGATGDLVAGLPARWRDMLGLLALLDRPAPPALLAAAAGTDLRSALDTLEGLDSTGLAGLGAQGWTAGRTGSGQDAIDVRRAVTAAMRPVDRARCHALLAAALRQRGADPAEVAPHLAAGGDVPGAAEAYADAARRRLDQVHDHEAARLAGAGLSLDPADGVRAALLEARGEARRRLGELNAARADFTVALNSHGDPAARSRMLAKLAILDARMTDVARGSELAELAIAEAGGQPAVLGQALAAAAIIDLAEGNLARGRYRVRRAARLLDRAGERSGGERLLYWRAMACFIDGRLREAAARLGQLAQLPVAPGEVLRLWSPRATRGHALVFLGQAADGLAEIEETLTAARTARHPVVEAECLWHRAEALAALGRGAEAIGPASQAAGIAARIGHAEWTAAGYRGLGIACEAAGLDSRAESAYRSSLQAAKGIPLFRVWASARLGALLARQGRPGEAAPHVRAALADGPPVARHEARWAQAEFLASQGDEQACRAAAAAALNQARSDGYLVLLPRLRELAGS
ncbi:MAG TPA: BTAD domain-containing putative transcriptional regulator [Trebonia sp.]|nr:BTAD domain-containing putative transcriptional regulator [Trebonia sp.]